MHELGYRKIGGKVSGKVSLMKEANAWFPIKKGKYTVKMALISARREKGH